MPKFRQKNDDIAGEVIKKLQRQPCTSATNLIHRVFEAGREGLQEIPERVRQVTHKEKVRIERSGLMKEDLQIELKNSYGYVTLQMPYDVFDSLTKKRKSNVKKIFQFVLAQVEGQVFRGGELIQNTVTFSGHELIDVGLYSDEFTEERGLKAAMSILTSIKLEGEMCYSPKMKPIRIDTLDVMFYRIENRDGEFTVFLNTQIDWNFVLYFFSHIPKYYYRLSARAASLAYQIFYLARQNTAKIKSEGKFTISLKAVRNALSIPLKATKQARRDIIEEIFRAADEIENAHKEEFGNTDLELFFLNCSEKMTPNEFITAINTGGAVLEVCMSGELAKPFIDFEEHKAIKINKVIKKSRAAKTAKS